MPEQAITEKSSLEKLRQIYAVARAENSDASLAERATLAGAFMGLAFDWSTGNESMLGFVGSTAHELTHHPLAVGVASGAVSFVEQGVIGTLVAYAIDSYPDAIAKVRETINHNQEVSKDTRAKRLARVMVLGSGVEVMVQNSKNHHTRPENTRRAIANAAIIGGANAALIGAVSGVMLLGERHGLESVTEPAVSILSNPLTYVAAIIGVVGFNKVTSAYRRIRKSLNMKLDDQKVRTIGE